MVAFVNRESEAARKSVEHLLRRLRPVAALEASKVVGRHVREFGHLFAAQPVGAASRSASKSDVLRLQSLAACPDECPKRCLIHNVRFLSEVVRSVCSPLRSFSHCMAVSDYAGPVSRSVVVVD